MYIIRCSDGTLYTGITNDIFSRVSAHNEGKGAKYTRGRGPVELIAERYAGSKSKALKLEAHVKKHPKDMKRWALLHWCFYHGPFLGDRCEGNHGQDQEISEDPAH